ncbi:MAG: helix-turn-helix domain-containing protein [Betaproteobacteria bacterium]
MGVKRCNQRRAISVSERRAWSWRQRLLESSLPGTTRHVLLTLSMHVNDAGEPCYPTVRLLAKETGRSRKTVMEQLEIGETEGWIAVGKHGFSGQKWATNEYVLAWPDDSKAVDKAVDNCKKGGYPALPPSEKGGHFDGEKVVTQGDHLQADLYIGFPNSIPNTPLSPDGDESGFVRWWNGYPKNRRLAKADCARQWRRKGLEGIAHQVIAVLTADVASAQWNRDDGQFIPLPLKWLKESRYERDAIPPAGEARCHCGAAARYRIGCHDFCSRHFDEATEPARLGGRVG